MAEDRDDYGWFDGWRLVPFAGGHLDGQQRLVPTPLVDAHSTYHVLVPAPQAWLYDAASDTFRLVS